MADRGAVCWESHLYGSVRGWRATLVRMKYSGTAGKLGGKQRKQTSSYSQGSLQPTRTLSPLFLSESYCGPDCPDTQPLPSAGTLAAQSAALDAFMPARTPGKMQFAAHYGQEPICEQLITTEGILMAQT